MSTSSQALTEARKIQTAMRDYGVQCVIQLKQGASRSGWLTPMSTRAGVMSHHIVSARTHGRTPFYNLVRNGRAGLPGPLANGYGGWDKVYRIITMGWANHPGAGGPITLAGRRVPKDNGRPYFWGTEYEGGLRTSDWAQDDYHAWMATCNAALLDAFNLPTNAHLEHLTWAPGRKIDRLGYTTGSGRDRINRVRGKKDWFAMATEADLRKIVREEIDSRTGSSVWGFRNTNHDSRDAWGILRQTEKEAKRNFAKELLSTNIQGMSVDWWLRNGLVLNPEHRQYPADPGSIADLIMRIAEETTDEPVVPYDGTQRRK